MAACSLCNRTGKDQVAVRLGLEAPCPLCRGKGFLTPLDRWRFWNLTNANGSFPARFGCLISGHAWEMIETIAFCAACEAVWDTEREERRPPARFTGARS